MFPFAPYLPRLFRGGRGDSQPVDIVPQGAFIVMPTSFGEHEGTQRLALREGPRRDDSHSRSPITPRDRRERRGDDRGTDRRRPNVPDDSWDANAGDDGWDANQQWSSSRDYDRDQDTWQSFSWHSQDEWRSNPWSSSGWQQGRPGWGRGNNKGKGKKGRGRGNKGRGKGWNQWSSSSWQQPKAANADTAAGSAVGSADDSWGNWGSGPAGAIAKAQPPVKKNVSATDAPVASAEPTEDEDPDNDPSDGSSSDSVPCLGQHSLHV